jgi:putative membrane protein
MKALEPVPVPLARAGLGGALMGLANLVPGVSGGTMLLASGVYPQFIAAVADVSRLRFRPRALVLIAMIVLAAGVAVLALAGPVRDLVVHRRWIMYSLFIGLTLGGVPIVWRLLRPATAGVWAGCALGLGLMVATLFVQPGGTGSGDGARIAFFFGGLAGASAMILPGVSGGYLLLVLGQYVPILGAVDLFKQALLGGGDGGGPDLALAMRAATILVPVGLGVMAGVLGVSNLLEWLLERFRKATLGVLLGLLLGAVLGLWPFQRSVAPEMGRVWRGVVVTPATLPSMDPEDWPLERFPPSAGQVAASLALIAAGFGVTLAIGRLGASRERVG